MNPLEQEPMLAIRPEGFLTVDDYPVGSEHALRGLKRRVVEVRADGWVILESLGIPADPPAPPQPPV